MRSYFLLPILLAACATAATNDALLTELRDSKSTPLAVPADVDIGFTMHLSMGAVLWAQLNDPQLLDWAHNWQAARGAADVPTYRTEPPAEGAEALTNWFDRSAKHGFCLVHAMAVSGMPIANTALLEAWRRLRVSPNR